MLRIVNFLLFSQALDLKETPIYHSIETPPGLIDKFSEFSNKMLIIDSENLKFPETTEPCPLFIDLTMKPEFHPAFDGISKLTGGKYLTLTDREYLINASSRIYTISSMDQEAKALKILSEWFGLEEIVLLSSSSPRHLKFLDIINGKLGKRIVKHFSYNQNLDFEYAQNFVQKEIKSFGVYTLLIIDQGKSLEIIQKSLISKRINDTGSLFIFPSFSIGSVFIEGSLIISQEYLESSSDYNEYSYLSIINSLKSSAHQPLNQKEAESSKSFSILNYKQGAQVKVGSISTNVSLSAVIIYPGGGTSLKSESTKELTFLIANGTNEVGNYNTYTLYSYFYNGAVYAVNEVNQNSLIPRFKLNLRPTDTGLFFYQEDWYKFKLSQVLFKPFPILYLTSYWATSAIGNFLALKALNFKLPQISPFAQGSIIENKEMFPDIVKISVSQDEFLSNGINFIKSLGWNSLVLFGTDDESFYPVFLATLRLCKARGIKIVNPEKFRVFPANYSRNDFEKYRNFFQAAKDTRCRVFLIVTFDKGVIWEGLYDVGLRKGDFYSVGDQAALNYLSKDQDHKILKKRAELIEGSFMLGYKEWNGDVGEKVFQVLSKVFPDVSYFCMSYDTVAVATKAIQYAILYGKDYENPEELMKIIRDTRVKACMGNVYFSRDSNSIAHAKFQISQILQDSSGNIYGSPLAYLDKFSDAYIFYINKTQWPESSVPENFIQIYDCPFEKREIQHSDKGLFIISAISLIVFITALIAALLSWKNFKHTYTTLDKPQLASLSDKAFFLYHIFQFLQFIDVGPDQDSLQNVLNSYNLLFSLDFQAFYNFKHQQFWTFYYMLISLALFLTFISILFIFNCHSKLSKFFFFEDLFNMKELLIPVITSASFLPLTSMLLNLFICTKSIGNSTTDLFMDYDCSSFCYTGDHKTFAVISVFVIISFVGVTVYQKPYWEVCQSCLSVRTKVYYLSLLSVFQVVLICLNKTLKFENKLIHGVVCTVLVFLLILVTVKLKPYNYSQANIIQLMSLSLIFWSFLTATIFQEIDNFVGWTAAVFIGFAVILVVGMIWISKIENLLKNPKGKDISSLFIFQFVSNYEKYAKDMNSLHFIRKESKYISIESTKNIPAPKNKSLKS